MAMITDRMRGGFVGDRYSSPWMAVSAAVSGIVTTLLVWLERASQRRQLLALSDHALQDMARSRADTAGESEKAFWQA